MRIIFPEKLRVATLRTHQSFTLQRDRSHNSPIPYEVTFIDNKKGVCTGELKEIADFKIAATWYPSMGFVEIAQKIPRTEYNPAYIYKVYVFQSNIISLTTYSE